MPTNDEKSRQEYESLKDKMAKEGTHTIDVRDNTEHFEDKRAKKKKK